MGTHTADGAQRRVGVIVVNYGSSDLLARNLAVYDSLERPHTVVVVDNWTTAEERRSVQELARERDWVLVAPATNTGFGGGVNLGVAAAREAGVDDILLLNPDAQLPPDDLETLSRAAAEDRRALYAPLIRRPDGRIWFQGLWVDERDGAMRRFDDPPPHGHLWLTGACIWMSMDAWDVIGGFDESYFLYWEDVDLSRRALDAGMTLHIVRDAQALHDVGGTQESTSQAKSPVYYFYSIRNRLLYATKHLDAAGIRRWRRDDIRQAWAIVMRGGRRQFLRPWKPLSAMWRGLRAGRALAAAALRERVTRVYATVRTAHLERDAGRSEVTLLAGERRYDFDAAAAAGLDLVETSTVGVFRHLVRHPSAVVEVNEPLQLRSAFRTAAALAALGVRRLFGAPRTVVVTYCIENLDPRGRSDGGVRARTKRRLQLMIARRVWRRLDRIAYGTPGARDLYAAVLGPIRRGAEAELIPALPTAADVPDERTEPLTAVFLGAFVERKGFREVLAAWPLVADAVPGARLLMMGKGAGEDEVRRAAQTLPAAEVLVDPPRAEIFERLAQATALVLPSQPQPGWREQVGLPIVEGLGAGCEIVTTTETGLAEWLGAHGHRTIDAKRPATELAEAIAAALTRARPRREILADLPSVDGRLAADAWLTRLRSV